MKKSYSKIIGYSPLDFVDYKKMLQVVRLNKKIIDEYFHAQKGDIVFVAGAGTGQEAELICGEFQLKTVGVDLNISRRNLPFADLDLSLQRQDLISLAFSKNVFSLVYCYHVLEHVTDHKAVLSELCRVLKPGGILFIGFPNKNRLLSYVGTSQKASWLDKVKWNLNDYLYRLQGKFENKYGAHAGFSEKEFVQDASVTFDAVYSVRNRYMLMKYPNFRSLITYIIKLTWGEFIFPSNYYICLKKEHVHD